jgi:hypothetical protein
MTTRVRSGQRQGGTGVGFLAACAAATALATMAGGCDWRDVDSLADHAPVLSVGAPGDFGPKEDFGRSVLPIAAPAEGDGVAARFVVAGIGSTGLAVVSLDGKGKPKARNIKSPTLSMLSDYPVPVLAEIPGIKPGRLLVGAPLLDGVVGGRVFVITLADTSEVTLFAMSGEPGFGIGLASANLAGMPAADYVVASADTLRVYVDGALTGMLPVYTSTDACPISLSATRQSETKMPVSRPVAVGHWVGAGTELQIAVGTPAAGAGKGSVSFFSVSATAITCLQTVSGAETLFGQALAGGDFNGDGAADVLVGAPPKNAYVYLGPLAATPAAVSLPADASAFKFGSAVAAVNVDGKGGDEAVVTDPNATVKGAELAGAAHVFQFAGATPAKLYSLADHDPQGGASYGVTVNALTFCATACSPSNLRRLVVVGAAAETFTYFKVGAGDTDPRLP